MEMRIYLFIYCYCNWTLTELCCPLELGQLSLYIYIWLMAILILYFMCTLIAYKVGAGNGDKLSRYGGSKTTVAIPL